MGISRTNEKASFALQNYIYTHFISPCTIVSSFLFSLVFSNIAAVPLDPALTASDILKRLQSIQAHHTVAKMAKIPEKPADFIQGLAQQVRR